MILSRITDRKIPCVYTHDYYVLKNRGTGPYNSLRHADNRKNIFGSLSNAKSKGSAMFYLAGEWEKFGDVLTEKKVPLS